jgi:hypothetical protein
MAAQKADPHGWIGTFADEQMEIFLQQTEDSGQLSHPTATLLRFCLPELGRRIEELCPVGMEPSKDGLRFLYGFPRTAGFPVVVSAIHFDQHQPVAASISGTVRHWRDRHPNASPSDAWREIIAATRASQWHKVSNLLTTRMASNGGSLRLAQHFETHSSPHAQLVVVALAAGDHREACGCSSVLALPALDLPPNSLHIRIA